jgi:hypothetical protein
MLQAAELARRITVQHRAPGFLRLELPAELCGPAAAAVLEAEMSALAGVSSAAVDRGWGRISIRWDENLRTAAEIARHLFGALAKLPEEPLPEAVPAGASGQEPVAVASGFQPALDKIKAMLAPAPGTPAGSLQARVQPVLASALTERAIINFFNDIVAFYLIRVHWDLITKRWLKTPLAYSDVWLTTFYLVFLLVRYRKSNPGK